MSTVGLVSPTVAPRLKPTVMPLTTMRTAVLGNLMDNFGFNARSIATCQQAYLDGLASGITIYGLDFVGHIQDHVVLHFADIEREVDITLNLSNDRSVIEAVSRKLAHVVLYSIETMRRKGLRLDCKLRVSTKGLANLAATEASTGLSAGASPTYAPEHAGRQVFSVSPGIDPGTTYTHFTARRIG